jgi:hypothetical protein
VNIPFCAFNGNRDVWVDVGDKRIGPLPIHLLRSYPIYLVILPYSLVIFGPTLFTKFSSLVLPCSFSGRSFPILLVVKFGPTLFIYLSVLPYSFSQPYPFSHI